MPSTNGSRTREAITFAAREHGWEAREYPQSVYLTRGDRGVNVTFSRVGNVVWAAAGTQKPGQSVVTGSLTVFRGAGKRAQVVEYLCAQGAALEVKRGVRGSTQIEGLGLYQYDQADFDYLMQHGQRTRASLVTEVLERTGDDHKNDGYRTLVRGLRKEQLAAMVAEWETGARENEKQAAQQRPAAVVTNVSDLTPAMRAVLQARAPGAATGGSTATIAALEDRGLIEYSATSNCYLLTDAGRRARVALAQLGEQVQAAMPTTTDYNGVKPSAQAPGYAYGFLRAAVLGQAAGRPFSDPGAAVRHLDECLRLAGYSVSTMEG